MSDAADADAAAADEERRRKRAEAAREKRAEQALAKGRQPGQRGRPGKQPAQLPPASPEPAHREREEPGSGNPRPRQAVRRDDVADARAELARLQALQESGGGPSNLDVLLAECIEAVDIAEDIAAAEAAEAAIAEDIAAAEAAIAADIAAAEAAEAAELIAAVEAVELEAAEAAAVVGADAEAAEAAAVVVADAGIIDAANASRFPPPRVTQHSDAATWYRRMMGYAWNGSSRSYALARKRYNRLLPENKAREANRDRSDRVRPEEDNERRVRERREKAAAAKEERAKDREWRLQDRAARNAALDAEIAVLDAEIAECEVRIKQYEAEEQQRRWKRLRLFHRLLQHSGWTGRVRTPVDAYLKYVRDGLVDETTLALHDLLCECKPMGLQADGTIIALAPPAAMIVPPGRGHDLVAWVVSLAKCAGWYAYFKMHEDPTGSGIPGYEVPGYGVSCLDPPPSIEQAHSLESSCYTWLTGALGFDGVQFCEICDEASEWPKDAFRGAPEVGVLV